VDKKSWMNMCIASLRAHRFFSNQGIECPDAVLVVSSCTESSSR